MEASDFPDQLSSTDAFGPWAKLSPWVTCARTVKSWVTRDRGAAKMPTDGDDDHQPRSG